MLMGVCLAWLTQNVLQRSLDHGHACLGEIGCHASALGGLVGC